jgi:SsrA-binding protein
MKIVAQNKKAHLEYELSDHFEAGLVLTGAEIKAIRANRVNLDGTFCRVMGREAWVLNMHIATVKEPERSRKLLLHKAEIQSLIGQTQQKNYTLIPTKLYIKKGKAKLEIALGRGKKLYDRREDIKKKDLTRQTARELSE